MPNNGDAVQLMDEKLEGSSNLGLQEKRTLKISKPKKKYKKKRNNTSLSDLASSASSNCCNEMSSAPKGIKISRNQSRIFLGSSPNTRRSLYSNDYDSLGLPLGMSIAAVVSQVLEKRAASAENLSVDNLSEICSMAVRESLANVFGDRFHNFSMNFEKSFRITLMTLRLITDSSQNSGGFSRTSSKNIMSNDTVLSSVPNVEAVDSEYRDSSSGPETVPFVPRAGFKSFGTQTIENMNRELVAYNDDVMQQQLVYASGSTSSSMLEKCVTEQARSNDLKAFEISLMMKNLHLQEQKMALKSDSNFLEKFKVSFGLSKASFKAEKFKTQLQEARQVELLKKCLDFLVAGLIIILLSLAYGTYIYSYRRIVEAAESCSPFTESKSRRSWFMPESVSTFNSGFQLLRCQVQVFSRIIFGALMIGVMAFLLVQRSSASHQSMPVTFILLLLGVACGYAGKFCIETLGGYGYKWLIYWEILCLVHFISNMFHSTLFVFLYGPIIVTEQDKQSRMLPFWVRRLIFFATLVIVPLLCGLTPFASTSEWFNHFQTVFVRLLANSEDEL